MEEPLRKDHIQGLQEKIEQLRNEQRRDTISIIERLDKTSSAIISAFFSESKKIREEIGYQTILLKTLEDNVSEIEFGEDPGLSSKIQVSVGGELLGTGAKWVLDIDTGKASHTNILAGFLQAIQLAPGIPNWVKKKAEAQVIKLLGRN